MTNIKENNKPSNVQTHIENAFAIINEFLPSPYVEKVLDILPEPKPKKGYIRNVRYRITPAHDKRVDIINALVKVSLANKAQLEELETLTTKS